MFGNGAGKKSHKGWFHHIVNHVGRHIDYLFLFRSHLAKQVTDVIGFTGARLTMKKNQAFSAGIETLHEVIMKIFKAITIIHVKIFDFKIIIHLAFLLR